MGQKSSAIEGAFQAGSHSNRGRSRPRRRSCQNAAAGINVPSLYLRRYGAGVTGDRNRRLLESPSYTGPRDINTYPEYSTSMLDSLNEIVEHAEVCLAVPYKRHFDGIFYEAAMQGYQLYKETILALKPLEVEGSDSPMARFFADQGCKSESRGKRQGQVVVGGCWRLPLLPTPGEHSPCPVEAIRPEQ